MKALFKSDKFSEEKQFQKLNKVIESYSKCQPSLNTLLGFINDILFGQMDITHNTNILPVVDNFVFHITKDIPLEVQKLVYIEYLFVDENSPKCVQEGKLYSLKRWRKDHEEKDLKVKKIRTKELNANLAKQIISNCVTEISKEK